METKTINSKEERTTIDPTQGKKGTKPSAEKEQKKSGVGSRIAGMAAGGIAGGLAAEGARAAETAFNLDEVEDNTTDDTQGNDTLDSGNSDVVNPVTPDPVTPDLDTPIPVTPDPVTPDPVNPDPQPITPHSDPNNVDPDMIADAIIAEEQIDPNDLDMAEVINFDDVGMVYTVTGESYNAALFHDEQGNQLMMVDVDGDELFDIITTTDGEVLVDQTGNVVEVGGLLSVSDAEMMLHSDPTYLASSDTDNVALPDGEDIMNDVVLS